MSLDWSAKGWPRVYVITGLGTALCVAVSFVFDSYSFTAGEWRWGSDPLNNLFIPLLLAPPFFFFLLNKMRQLAIAHSELMTVASTDGLTSLLNRRAFTEMVDGYLKRVEAASISDHSALLVIDVDHFKAVNDRFGHDSGDEALKLIAKTIGENVRGTDLIGRIGGEEFSVFMPKQTPELTSVVAERIRMAIDEASFTAKGERADLSVSIGGVTFSPPAAFDDLYREADELLYDAKRNGRNRVELHAFDEEPRHNSSIH